MISNLTVWDTYGKLVGLDRTPSEIRRRLQTVRGWGAYLVYLGISDAIARELPANQLIALTDLQDGKDYDPIAAQFTFAISAQDDPRAPAGMRAATVQLFTDVEDWFTYHEDESDHEEKDTATFAALWPRLLAAIPELGESSELIETVTPRTFYENTRRKLGMVGGIGHSPIQSVETGLNAFSHETAIPNLFMVGDTTLPGAGVAAVSHGALALANQLTGRR